MSRLTQGGLPIANPTAQSSTASAVTSVFGRANNVQANVGDYSLNQMSDVDTSTVSPIPADVLVWKGTKWEPSNQIDGGTY